MANSTTSLEIFIANFNLEFPHRGSTAFFPCQIGVGQGKILSPMLFSIYLYDLKSFLVRNHVPGIKCEVNEEDVYIYINLLALLFADDTIIFGNNKEDLQLALDVFEKYCTEWNSQCT